MYHTSRPVITGRKGVISSGHYLATIAGTKMLAKGGNAIDGKATIKWFKDNGIRLIPGDGYLGATVPGLFGAYATALMRFGRLSLADIMAPAIEIAEYGFPTYKWLSDSLKKHENDYLAKWSSTADVFKPGGCVHSVGQLIKQPALARTMRKIVEAEIRLSGQGRDRAIRNAMDFFYQGEIADKMLEYSKNNPVRDVSGKSHTALLEKEDFLAHETRIEEPVCADYKEYRVYKCGPWTQGPVFLQQLKLLECSKLAFADRNKYYGDPLFSDVPLERLFSGDYNQDKRKLVNLDRANNSELDEPEELADIKTYTGDTTHLDVIDDEGFMMSATPSGGWIPTSPLIPELGFPLGTRAQCFNLNEGHPNSLQPGKRPRITLTPSLAFKGGKPWIVFGTSGGDHQDQWLLQFFLNLVEFDMDLQEAIDKPAFHTRHFRNTFYPKDINPCTLFLEKEIKLEDMMKLQDMGHKLNILHCNDSQVNAVRINHETGCIEGAASYKYDGQSYAYGW